MVFTGTINLLEYVTFELKYVMWPYWVIIVLKHFKILPFTIVQYAYRVFVCIVRVDEDGTNLKKRIDKVEKWPISNNF